MATCVRRPGALKGGLAGRPSATEWAYIAGLFDGEGSITLHNQKNAGPGYRVDVAQQQADVLHWLKTTLGAGEVRVRSTPERRKADDFRIIRQREVYQFLRGVLPYLIVKRAKAEQVVAELAAWYPSLEEPF